jgi:MYXO-CTERM domain-containing protein
VKKITLAIALLVLLAPASAWAFCGFYVAGGDAKLFNEATQVVLMRHGTKTVLSMQNNYEGPPKDFAMVVPVPQVLQKENVKTLEKGVFDRVDKMSAPRLVEYWERDPCYEPPPRRRYKKGVRMPMAAAEGAADKKVVVEAEFKVGEYDVVVLSAEESTALDTYLRQENYNIPDGAEPYFKPYIDGGMYFFVAKVDSKKVKYADGRAVLSPLRFAYDSEKFALPIRLGMINSKGKQDLLVYILAQNQRYQVANYPNVFIPTNVGVRNEVRDEFANFYRTLFDRTTEENPGAVVTEYSWAASTCDPCPGPTLNPSDFQVLGSDEMENVNDWQWVLTRLHARYERDDIGEDLVFEAAPPVVGGREHRDQDGALERGAKPGSQNNFQGRYIIRHEWTGDVDCKNPQFGVWGGPSGKGAPQIGANPSPNTRGAGAGVPKKARKLPEYLKEKVDIPKASPASIPAKEPSQETAATVEPEGGPVSTPDRRTQQKKNKCSVAGVGALAPVSATAVFLLALVAAIRRRRR